MGAPKSSHAAGRKPYQAQQRHPRDDRTSIGGDAVTIHSVLRDDDCLAEITSDLLLRELLQIAPVCDAQLEQVLTALRRFLLDLACDDAQPAVSDDAVGFLLCAGAAMLLQRIRLRPRRSTSTIAPTCSPSGSTQRFKTARLSRRFGSRPSALTPRFTRWQRGSLVEARLASASSGRVASNRSRNRMRNALCANRCRT